MKIEITLTLDNGWRVTLDSSQLDNHGLDALSIDQARELRRVARAIDARLTTKPLSGFVQTFAAGAGMVGDRVEIGSRSEAS